MKRSSSGTSLNVTCLLSIILSAIGCMAHGAEGPLKEGNTTAALTPAGLYSEKFRPQFHFTARKNWLNDPNGLVFYQGEYHLFFQHNPSGINWGNMTWGHAVSPDLVHWTQMDNAIEPDKLGTIFSGSAVVDWNNSAGFQTGEEKPIVCIYTSAGKPFTQSIAYSNDRGRSWTKYEKNPVLGHIAGSNRDPKVFWHAPTRKWVMPLFLDGGKYALFGSPNLREWTKLSDLPPSGAEECPDLFELPVDGDAANTRWIFWGGNGNYLIGGFDGTTFTKEAGPLRFEHGKNSYAAQTYSDIPARDGRRIQIAWMRDGKYPGMPFNQQMSFPCELRLRSFPEGMRICSLPVAEIKVLYGKSHAWKNENMKLGENLLKDVAGGLYDIQMQVDPGGARSVGIKCRGEMVTYSTERKLLTCLGREAPVDTTGGPITLRILVDRTSLEVFASDGKAVLTSCFLAIPDEAGLELFADGGSPKILSMTVHELKSSWPMGN